MDHIPRELSPYNAPHTPNNASIPISLSGEQSPVLYHSRRPSNAQLHSSYSQQTDSEEGSQTPDVVESTGLPRRGHAFKRTEEPPRNAANKIICCHKECINLSLTFDRKCEWSKHMDKHDRPYKCTIAGCEKLQGYTYSGGLLRHEREVHKMYGGVKKSLFCPFPDCKRSSGQGFTRKENLAEHIRRVHHTTDEEREVSLQDLVAIQTATGSFPLERENRECILNKMDPRHRCRYEKFCQAIRSPSDLQKEALDTLLVIRFIYVTFPEEKQLWELMVQKAERWVKSQLPESVISWELEGLHDVQPEEPDDEDNAKMEWVKDV
ncbi:uncharacterized protein BDZ99DRAFT_450218 [Mytilinidion resinicola]|uniref:C2H2-type domain-containing protein n=1 Tax=Mytilinidion resinicola TaxID=574789 RepID=A0A6A6YC36_9PEZI|nr:uncharacterized protein BDZ99DRAFT_450218 [Mytilinidion resinicola]KAF2805584.1 hypothetical protein BDZ99DRAFT_450218 [Mytilinidion resinicola]